MQSSDSGGGNGGGLDSELGCEDEGRPFDIMAGGPEEMAGGPEGRGAVSTVTTGEGGRPLGGTTGGNKQ